MCFRNSEAGGFCIPTVQAPASVMVVATRGRDAVAENAAHGRCPPDNDLAECTYVHNCLATGYLHREASVGREHRNPAHRFDSMVREQ